MSVSHISLSPNTQSDDIKLAWRTLWDANSASNEHIKKATALASEYLPGMHVTLTSSGRSALYYLLKSLKIGRGHEVIIQAFTCIAVPEPIIWNEATPVYADIIKETYNIDPEDVLKKITPNTKAVIVQHTFGIPGPIEELQKICKEHNLVLIEDCAHALGAEYKGKPLGSYGDASIFSFGRDKTISSVYGGAIAVKDSALATKVQEQTLARSIAPSSWINQQLLHPVLTNLFLPLYNIASLGKALLKIAQDAKILSMAVSKGERRGEKPEHITYSYPAQLAVLLVNQWQKLSQYTTIRRGHAHAYSSALKETSARLPGVSKEANPSWLRMPLQVKNPKALLELAKSKGVVLGDWYDSVLAPSTCDISVFQYAPGSCPVAEDTAMHVINLPTHPRLTIEQRNLVISLLENQHHLL